MEIKILYLEKFKKINKKRFCSLNMSEISKLDQNLKYKKN